MGRDSEGYHCGPSPSSWGCQLQRDPVICPQPSCSVLGGDAIKLSMRECPCWLEASPSSSSSENKDVNVPRSQVSLGWVRGWHPAFSILGQHGHTDTHRCMNVHGDSMDIEASTCMPRCIAGQPRHTDCPRGSPKPLSLSRGPVWIAGDSPVSLSWALSPLPAGTGLCSRPGHSSSSLAKPY